MCNDRGMRVQDYMARLTSEATETLIRFVRSTPEERWTWSPLDQGRTVLDQLQECARVPLWFDEILTTKASPSWPEDFWMREREARKVWDTVDRAEEALLANTARLTATIRTLSDEDLEIMVTLPFRGGVRVSLADILQFHLRNLYWHAGQIAYVQTLYGDRDMH